MLPTKLTNINNKTVTKTSRRLLTCAGLDKQNQNENDLPAFNWAARGKMA